jgi:hypothetical protein
MAIDWTMLFKKYKGMWVGLKEDNKTVIAFGKTVEEVMNKAKDKGFEHPILFRVPNKIVPFVGNFRV